jgi:hypothetical protein
MKGNWTNIPQSSVLEGHNEKPHGGSVKYSNCLINLGKAVFESTRPTRVVSKLIPHERAECIGLGRLGYLREKVKMRCGSHTQKSSKTQSISMN